MKPIKRHQNCKNRLIFDDTMWRVVAEWAPGLFWVPVGGLGMRKFGPHHFRTLYTHINQIMQKKKKKKKKSKKIARELFSSRPTLKSKTAIFPYIWWLFKNKCLWISWLCKWANLHYMIKIVRQSLSVCLVPLLSITCWDMIYIPGFFADIFRKK